MEENYIKKGYKALVKNFVKFTLKKWFVINLLILLTWIRIQSNRIHITAIFCFQDHLDRTEPYPEAAQPVRCYYQCGNQKNIRSQGRTTNQTKIL